MPRQKTLLPAASAGELLVARIWSWKAEKLRRDAERQYAQMPADGRYYAVSGWGAVVGEDGDVLATMQELSSRLLKVPLNGRYIGFTPAHRLQEERFGLVESPPPGHLDVVLGNTLDDERLIRLEGLWSESCKRWFADCTLAEQPEV